MQDIQDAVIDILQIMDSKMSRADASLMQKYIEGDYEDTGLLDQSGYYDVVEPYAEIRFDEIEDGDAWLAKFEQGDPEIDALFVNAIDECGFDQDLKLVFKIIDHDGI